jgi:hypothetical protein
MAAIAPRVLADEEYVRQFRGKRFWREMLNVIYKYIMEALEISGITGDRAHKITSAAISHMIPMSFQKFVSRAMDDIIDRVAQTGETESTSETSKTSE